MPAYFAYGSNMSTPRLEARVGVVRLLGVARLEDYVHRFSKHGNDGTAKGNVEAVAGGCVWGVLFELSGAQLATLATYEGGYRQVELVPRLDTTGEQTPAASFEALAIARGLRPTQPYLAHYLAGMREHQLPLAYQRELFDDAGLELPG